MRRITLTGFSGCDMILYSGEEIAYEVQAITFDVEERNGEIILCYDTGKNITSGLDLQITFFNEHKEGASKFLRNVKFKGEIALAQSIKFTFDKFEEYEEEVSIHA